MCGCHLTVGQMLTAVHLGLVALHLKLRVKCCKVLVAMDMLVGIITYAVLLLEDEFDDGIRRGFLLSGGRSFM